MYLLLYDFIVITCTYRRYRIIVEFEFEFELRLEFEFGDRDGDHFAAYMRYICTLRRSLHCW